MGPTVYLKRKRLRRQISEGFDLNRTKLGTGVIDDGRVMESDYDALLKKVKRLNDYDQMIDEEYLIYLKHLVENGDTPIPNVVEEGGAEAADPVKTVVAEPLEAEVEPVKRVAVETEPVAEMEEEEEEADPHFKMFMENLVGDGKSYVLKVYKADGVVGFLKYEGPEDWDEDCVRENPVKVRKESRREKAERRKKLGSVESVEMHAKKKRKLGVQRKDDEGNHRSLPDVEKSKCMFQKENRASEFRQRDDADKSKSFPQKEGKNLFQSTDIGGNSVGGENLRTEDEGENQRNLRTNSGNAKIEEIRNVKSRDNVEKRKNVMKKEMDNSAMEENFRSVHLSNVSCKKKRPLSEKVRCDKENHGFDSCYKLFLDRCVIEGDSIFVVDNGKRFKYEEDDDDVTSSDSDVMVLDSAPDCMKWNYTPIQDSDIQPNAPMEEADLQILGSRSEIENPQFRKEVMDILRKPYSEEEYERLWYNVNLQKPIEGHRQLRSGNKSYPTDVFGKSYLDHYSVLLHLSFKFRVTSPRLLYPTSVHGPQLPIQEQKKRKESKSFDSKFCDLHYADLKRKLDVDCDLKRKLDLPKKLNILRGFFYYLENVSEDGKFKPWLDESCLATVPEQTKRSTATATPKS